MGIAEDLAAALHGFLAVRFRLAQFPLVLKRQGQIADGSQGVGIEITKEAAPVLQGLPEERLSLLGLALVMKQHSQTTQGRGKAGVILA